MGLGPVPGGNSSLLDITAAVVVKASPGTLWRIAVLNGGSANNLTINDANALVTAQTITGITVASAAVVTLSSGGASNPFAVGNTIAFASVGGMTQINAQVGQVTAIGGVTTAWTVTTNIDSSGFSAWTSGGTAASFSAASQVLNLLFSSLALTAGVPVLFEWPFQNGILVSAVPTGSQFAISYS